MNLRSSGIQWPRGNECGSFTRVNGSLPFLGIRAPRVHSLSLPACLLSHSPAASARRVKAYPSVCARNKPLDNLCIPNERYYLSSAAVNKIYKLDAAHIFINFASASDKTRANATLVKALLNIVRRKLSSRDPDSLIQPLRMHRERHPPICTATGYTCVRCIERISVHSCT